jgi:hypothetical protein
MTKKLRKLERMKRRNKHGYDIQEKYRSRKTFTQTMTFDDLLKNFGGDNDDKKDNLSDL